MLTQQQVFDAISTGKYICVTRKSPTECINGDLSRIAEFFPKEKWPELGYTYHYQGIIRPWIKAEIISSLRRDVCYAHSKEKHKKTTPYNDMLPCVNLWLWVLCDTTYTDEVWGSTLEFYEDVIQKY